MTTADQYASDDIVTVWHDTTSDEPGYIVDTENEDGTVTINVFDDRDKAIEYGRKFAEKSRLRFEDRT
jgi:hypothetical protein